MKFLIPLLLSSFFVNAMELPQRQHPFLLLDSQEISNVRTRTQTQYWAYSASNTILNTANTALGYNQIIPDTVDSVLHKNHWGHIYLFSQAYVLTGYQVYADAVGELLIQYADVYPDWGSIFPELLLECQYICKGVWAYDVIYNSSSLTDDDRLHIETDLFRNMAIRIQSNPMENNHQTWHNAAMLGIGLVLEDPQIAEEALYGQVGFEWQIKNWVLSDGWWAETTPSYHLFALDAVRYTVRAAYKTGIDYTTNKAYKAMYDVVVDYIQPDLSLPTVNDTTSTVSFYSDRRHFYEWAYAQFQDTRYLELLNSGERSSIDSLLFGVDTLPSTPVVQRQSKLYEGAGCMVLRSNADLSQDKQSYVHFDYGLPGGWHGHRDMLSLIFYNLGTVLLPDPSLHHTEISYTSPEWKYWYKHSFAHNTVTVDQKSQKLTSGSLVFSKFEQNFSIVQAQCDSAYEDIIMRRTLVLTEKYLIDVFELAGSEYHCYDWVCHGYGAVNTDAQTSQFDKPIGYTDGYEYMSDIECLETEDNLRTYFKNGESNVAVNTLGQQGTRLFLGDCDVNSHLYPTMVVRRNGKNAVFISVIEPYSQQPSIASVESVSVDKICGNAKAVRIVDTDGGEDIFMISDYGGVEREFAGIHTDKKVYYAQKRLGKEIIHYVD